MIKKCLFMPLGGGQEVGANSYYLKLGEMNFLLDCGGIRLNGVNYSPAFDKLLQMSLLQDLHQISHVFISHGHMDHFAALPNFLQLNELAAVYTTDITRQIMKLQFGEKFTPTLQERFSTVSFLQKIPLPNVTISFHRAGHIPGAMMTLFEYGSRRILYTGDYSTFATPLVDAAILPQSKIDVLILCGLHARHSKHRADENALTKILHRIRRTLIFRKIPYCQVNQISKGIELLKLIHKYFPNVEIFIDSEIMKIVHSFEQLQIPIMNARFHPLNSFPDAEGVILSTTPPPYRWNCEEINCNFSLHDDFNSVVNFVNRINPKLCIVVHSPPDTKNFEETTIEQVLIHNPDSRTNFIFPEDFIPYEI